MEASLCKFASLTPFYFSIPPSVSLVLQNTVYFRRAPHGHKREDLFSMHQLLNLSDIKIRKSKPSHNKLRQNGNEHRIVFERQLIFSVQALLLIYSNTISAITLLDWQQHWITLPNLSLSTCHTISNPTRSTSLAELQLLYFSRFSDVGIFIFLAMNQLLCTSTHGKISYC